MLEMLWKFVSRQFEMNFTISLKNLGVHVEKYKVRLRSPHADGPLRKILKHEIEVYNPWWLVSVSFLYDNLYWNKQGFFFSFLMTCCTI